MTTDLLGCSTPTAAAPDAGATRTQPPAQETLPCLRHDPELWFAERPEDVERAKELCGPCPIREVCLAGALDRGEPWGVWGGQLVSGGVVVPRKRPRGRPRKHPPAG